MHFLFVRLPTWNALLQLLGATFDQQTEYLHIPFEKNLWPQKMQIDDLERQLLTNHQWQLELAARMLDYSARQ